MPKNPFDESDSTRRYLKNLGFGSAFEEMRKQDRLYREFLDPPMMRALRQSASFLKQYEEQNRSAAQALALFDIDMREITRHAEEFQRAISSSLGPYLEAYERQLAELRAPLSGLAAQLEREQRSITAALSVFSVEELAGLTGTAAHALQQHYRMLAETADFGIEATDAALEVVEALKTAEAGTPPSSALAEKLIAALVNLLATLVRNTSKRVQQIDLIEIFFILATIQQLQPDYTDDDRTRDEANFEVVQRIEDQIKQVAAARTAQMEYVSSLHRAVIIGAGRIREAPIADSKILTKLPKETPVAIAEKQGRWRRVAYRDELTGDLAEGWIWSASIKELNN